MANLKIALNLLKKKSCFVLNAINYFIQGNYEMIIIHHINEEEYREAIENLKHVKDEIVNNDLLYRYCHIFMKHEPGNFN